MALYLTSPEMTLETCVAKPPEGIYIGIATSLPAVAPRKDGAVRRRLAVGGWLQAGVSPTENQRASFGTGLKSRYFYPFLVKIPAGSL